MSTAPTFTPGPGHRPYPPQQHYAGRHLYAVTAPQAALPADPGPRGQGTGGEELPARTPVPYQAAPRPQDPVLLGRVRNGLASLGPPAAPGPWQRAGRPQLPADDGWMRDLITRALRALAGNLDGITALCPDCLRCGSPCARHAPQVAEASAVRALAGLIAGADGSRNALLALSIAAEAEGASISGD